MNEDLLRFAPPDWLEKFEAAASVPVKGPVRDPDGVVHEIYGDYTACDVQWACQGPFGAQAIINWAPVNDTVAHTCIACLRDIHRPEE